MSSILALPSSASTELAMPSISSNSGLILSIKSGPFGPGDNSYPAWTTRGLIFTHAVATEMVSSAGGADSDESDSGTLQLVRAIAAKANATVAL